MNYSIRFSAALAVLLLAACAPQQVVRKQGDEASTARQQAREQQLAQISHWSLQGQISVSNGHDGGSGTLTWTQDGDHYEFDFRAPITGKSFRLTGGADGAVLEGVDGGPQHGPNAEALMQRVLGWDVPLSALRAWVVGVRVAGADAQLSYGDDGLLSQLQQEGWVVTYPAWDTTRQPPLPTKVFAANPPYKVRLAIASWTMP